MATQIKPTPILYGKYAEAALKQIEKRISDSDKAKALKRKSFFDAIKKRGLS